MLEKGAAAAWDVAIKGGGLDTHLPSDLFDSDRRIGQHRLRTPDLGLAHGRLTAAATTERSCLGKAGMGTLKSELALELCDGREEMKG